MGGRRLMRRMAEWLPGTADQLIYLRLTPRPPERSAAALVRFRVQCTAVRTSAIGFGCNLGSPQMPKYSAFSLRAAKYVSRASTLTGPKRKSGHDLLQLTAQMSAYDPKRTLPVRCKMSVSDPKQAFKWVAFPKRYLSYMSSLFPGRRRCQ